jgi:hypothetical protein
MIPVEMITMLGGSAVGGLLKIVGMHMEAKRLQNTLLMEKFTESVKAIDGAREGPSRGWRNFQWTRRVIALSVIFSVIVLPKLVVFLPGGVDVAYGWGESVEDSFFGLFPGYQIQHWKVLEDTLLITPLDGHLVAAIAGIYFGSSADGHNK